MQIYSQIKEINGSTQNKMEILDLRVAGIFGDSLCKVESTRSSPPMPFLPSHCEEVNVEVKGSIGRFLLNFQQFCMNKVNELFVRASVVRLN